jgi:hypothetical protein
VVETDLDEESRLADTRPRHHDSEVAGFQAALGEALEDP